MYAVLVTNLKLSDMRLVSSPILGQSGPENRFSRISRRSRWAIPPPRVWVRVWVMRVLRATNVGTE